jgi:hypothetical protein
MQQIEHQAIPAGEFGHEDHINLASLGEAEDLLTLFTVIFGAGRGFLADTDDLVARLLGEGLEIALLEGVGLSIVGLPAGVDGDRCLKME